MILDFGLNPQPFATGRQDVKANQRIVMNFYTAKRLLTALGMTIQRHEGTFGSIELDVRRRAGGRPGPAADRPPGRGRVTSGRPIRSEGVSGRPDRPGTPSSLRPGHPSSTAPSAFPAFLSSPAAIFSDPDDYDERFRDAGRAGGAETPDDSAQRGPPVAPISDDAGHLGLGSGWTSLGLGDDGMSHPSRPRASGPAQRRPRGARLEAIAPLEERQLLAPVVAGPAARRRPSPPLASQPTARTNLGTVTFTNTLPSQTGATNALTAFPEAAAITSVSELTPTTSFGGDIVRIRPGPGGEFGNDVYAISRGAGDNAANGAINRPGVIYRVDPATGKSTRLLRPQHGHPAARPDPDHAPPTGWAPRPA